MLKALITYFYFVLLLCLTVVLILILFGLLPVADVIIERILAVELGIIIFGKLKKIE